MKIYKTKQGIIIEKGNKFYLSKDDWDLFINDENLFQKMEKIIQSSNEVENANRIIEEEILAPVGSQELWACGVTYLRSKEGRQEESKDAGGGDFYARVYEAERPEVFFKSTSHRIVGHNGNLRIRKDYTWDVTEPELTFVVTS
jgi:2-dehydro-3-deoxy-D-arabinonate dehydratase